MKAYRARQGEASRRSDRPRKQARRPAHAPVGRPRDSARDAVFLRRASRHADRRQRRAHHPVCRPVLRLFLRSRPAPGDSQEPQLPRTPPEFAGLDHLFDRRHHPDGVVDVERGRIDYIADGIGAATAERLRPRSGLTSDAARQGRQRLFVTRRDSSAPGAQCQATALPRRAHAPGVQLRDRPSALAGSGRRRRAIRRPHPRDQYLSPAVPGFRDVEIYPLDGPDLAAAKRLTGPARNGGAVHVTAHPVRSKPRSCAQTCARSASRSRSGSSRWRSRRSLRPDAAFDIGRFAWIRTTRT